MSAVSLTCFSARKSVNLYLLHCFPNIQGRRHHRVGAVLLHAVRPRFRAPCLQQPLQSHPRIGALPEDGGYKDMVHWTQGLPRHGCSFLLWHRRFRRHGRDSCPHAHHRADWQWRVLPCCKHWEAQGAVHPMATFGHERHLGRRVQARLQGLQSRSWKSRSPRWVPRWFRLVAGIASQTFLRWTHSKDNHCPSS